MFVSNMIGSLTKSVNNKSYFNMFRNVFIMSFKDLIVQFLHMAKQDRERLIPCLVLDLVRIKNINRSIYKYKIY